eukprot:6186083-Pleurochrysis_carterae.AAC.1
MGDSIALGTRLREHRVCKADALALARVRLLQQHEEGRPHLWKGGNTRWRLSESGRDTSASCTDDELLKWYEVRSGRLIAAHTSNVQHKQ